MPLHAHLRPVHRADGLSKLAEAFDSVVSRSSSMRRIQRFMAHATLNMGVLARFLSDTLLNLKDPVKLI